MWNWFSPLAPKQRTLRARRSVRPHLEALEARYCPSGGSLDWSDPHGSVCATAVDSSGNIYITGNGGTNLPTTPGAYLTTGSGAFVAKLDPTGNVLYATYLANGTTGNGAGSGIAIDAAGDAYVIGESGNLQTTPNAIASAPSGIDGPDVFVAELNPTGSGLLYSTYIPGAISYSITPDFSGSIAVDGSGNISVAGAAQAGLPVTANAFQTSGGGAFFMKIDPALSGTASVLYASYLGGSGGDMASSIALDSSGNAYLYGTTGSSNFPTTSGAFQRTYGGNHGLGTGDAFVAKFNPTLSGAASLVFSTYLGGSASDGYVPEVVKPLNSYSETINPAGGIAVDSAGNVYVTGSTESTNFPTTAGAYQTTSNFVNNSKYNDGNPPSDIFVTKLNATGSALVYSTYLGGGGNAYQVSKGKTVSVGTQSGSGDIAVDASGDAYVTGWTNSTSFPTVNPIEATNNAGTSNGYELSNAIVTVLDPAGSGLLFSTYLSSSSQDWGYSIALNSANNVYVAGAIGTDSGSFFVAKIGSPVGGTTATSAIAATSSGKTASSGQAMTNSGSPQVQKNNGQPALSPADQPFTLVGNNPGVSATQTVLSDAIREWQPLESTLLARFDALLSMGFNDYMNSMAQDIWLRDLLFASLSSNNV